MDVGNLGPGLYEASWIGLVFNPQTKSYQLTFVLFYEANPGEVSKDIRTLCLGETYKDWVNDFVGSAGLCYCKDQPKQCLPGSLDIDCEVSLKALPGCQKRACLHQIHLESGSYEVPTAPVEK